ncbi:MAG TPA: hypothetical protein VN325_30130 [Steroidobacteraceae bacterium]|nr:hypothetical protein [Steroidobacteraceae bacterium]
MAVEMRGRRRLFRRYIRALYRPHLHIRLGHPDAASALAAISGDPAYRDLFQKAYGRAPSKVEALIASCVGRTIESSS